VNHKKILAALIVGFCLIFVGSLLGSISSFNINYANLEHQRGDIDVNELRNAIDLGVTLVFVDQLLQIIGGLILAVFSAVGAFIIEDRYATLGLLLFSALVTVFVGTTIIFRLQGIPTYYPI
jgi:hypothetical protein